MAGGLSLLLLGLFIPVFSIAWRTWERAQASQSAQRDALAVAYRLRRDYAASKPESLLVSRSGTRMTLSFVSYDSATGTEPMWTAKGEILWRKWVQYRYESRLRSVYRREEALATPTRTPPPSAPSWRDRDAHRLASHIELFDLTARSADIRLSLRLRARDQQATSSTQINLLPTLYALDTMGQ